MRSTEPVAFAAAGPAPSLRKSLGTILVLTLAIGVGFCAMQSFAILGESAKAELSLSDAALATIQGVSAALPLVLLSIPIGLLVDRVARVRLTLALGALWTAGTLVTALAPGAAVLFAGRMMVGIGTTGALTAVLSLSADLCHADERGRVMLINTLGKTAGIAAGFALVGGLLGWLAAPAAPHWFGSLSAWRSSQVVLALASATLLAPLALTREPPRHEREAAPDAPFAAVMAELWARRGFLAPLFVGQCGVVMADAAANIWAAPILERRYGLAPASFAGWLGATLLVTGVAGALVGGIVADWGHKAGQKSGRRGGLLIGAVGAAVLGVPAALFAVMPDVTTFAIAIGALMIAGTVTGLIASVALTVYLPNELRGLSIGAFIAIAGLVGFGIAPPLVAWVGGWLGGGRHIAEAQAFVGVIVGAVSVAGYWSAMRNAPEPV